MIGCPSCDDWRYSVQKFGYITSKEREERIREYDASHPSDNSSYSGSSYSSPSYSSSSYNGSSSSASTASSLSSNIDQDHSSDNNKSGDQKNETDAFIAFVIIFIVALFGLLLLYLITENNSPVATNSQKTVVSKKATSASTIDEPTEPKEFADDNVSNDNKSSGNDYSAKATTSETETTPAPPPIPKVSVIEGVVEDIQYIYLSSTGERIPGSRVFIRLDDEDNVIVALDFNYDIDFSKGERVRVNISGR